MERIDLDTPDLTQENVQKLGELFPQVLTEVRDEHGQVQRAVDFDALRDLLGDVAEGTRERYQFTWPGKREAKAEARRPIHKTMRPCPEESVNWDTTENLYIEGDNLDALKILKETYAGKVKMIYIDPPYNTGHDFVYDDDFAKTHSEYAAESGDYDGEGGRLVANPESNGRFHSDWCSMMYPRLMLARDLLSSDGVIFISIDDNEQSNLVKLCDEVFGAASLVNHFAWISNITGRQISGHGAAKTWESILVYAKSVSDLGGFETSIEFAKRNMPDAYKGFSREVLEDSRGSFVVGDTLYNHNRIFNEETRPNLVFSIYFNPVTGEIVPGDIGGQKDGFIEIKPHSNGDGKHKYHAWRWSREKILRESYDLIVLPTSKGDYELYTRIRDFDSTLLKDYITNIPNGDSEVRKLFEGKRYFDYPKATSLIQLFINAASDGNGLIVDFFSGSGTTMEAVAKANLLDNGSRRCILVQLPEALGEGDIAKADGYSNICEIGKERIRRAGDKIKKEVEDANRQLKLGEEPKKVPDVGFRVLKIDSTNFTDVMATPDATSQQMLLDFSDNLKDGRSDMDILFEVLPKFRVPYSAKIEETVVCGKRCFVVDGNLLVACFDKSVGIDTIEAIAKMQPVYAVMRDASMADDATHANFEELFKTYSPDTVRRVI